MDVENMNKMKACVGCRFFVENWGPSCFCPEIRRPDPIRVSIAGYPPLLRKPEGGCSPEARYFEPKPPGLLTKLYRAPRSMNL